MRLLLWTTPPIALLILCTAIDRLLDRDVGVSGLLWSIFQLLMVVLLTWSWFRVRRDLADEPGKTTAGPRAAQRGTRR